MSEYANTATGSYANTAQQYDSKQESVRMPEIVAQATELAADLELTVELAAKMEGRLEGVLSPSPPNTESRDTSDQSINTQLGNHLFEQRRKVQAVNARLRNLLSRCEL